MECLERFANDVVDKNHYESLHGGDDDGVDKYQEWCNLQSKRHPCKHNQEGLLQIILMKC